MSVKVLLSCLLLAFTYVASISSVLSHECPKWGYIDKSGRMVIQPFAGGQGPFIDGIAQVWTADGSKAEYINKSGKIVIKPTWEGVQPYGGFPFSEGLAAVNYRLPDGRQCGGYIDTSGKFVIKPVFKYTTPFSEGLAVVEDQNGKRGYIDKIGKFVIQPQFDTAYPVRSGVAITLNGGAVKISCLGPKGSHIDNIRPVVKYFDTSGKEMSRVDAEKKGMMVGNSLRLTSTVLTDKQSLFDDKSFDEVHPFSDGMAAVQKNGLWGFIDSTGKLVIEPQFDRVEDFSDGLAAVHFAESSQSREPIKKP